MHASPRSKKCSQPGHHSYLSFETVSSRFRAVCGWKLDLFSKSEEEHMCRKAPATPGAGFRWHRPSWRVSFEVLTAYQPCVGLGWIYFRVFRPQKRINSLGSRGDGPRACKLFLHTLIHSSRLLQPRGAGPCTCRIYFRVCFYFFSEKNRFRCPGTQSRPDGCFPTLMGVLWTRRNSFQRPCAFYWRV